MSRYLIIDTKKLDQLFSRSDNFETFMGYILSEEETLSKFKEVFEAGKNYQEDYHYSIEWSRDIDDDFLWENFSKTL